MAKSKDLSRSAKFEFKVAFIPREDEMREAPTLQAVDDVITAALKAAFPEWEEVRVYDGSRPDLD